MIGEAVYCDGKAYITLKSPELLEGIQTDAENRALSLIAGHEYEEAEEMIGFLIALEKTYKDMIHDREEETDE